MRRSKQISRRNFLKGSAALGASLGLGSTMPALAGSHPTGGSLARRQSAELLMWWWGEQELPGLQDFVDQSIAAWDGGSVEAVLQDTSVVISQFQTASAANEAPDLQYLWNGIYHMESVWFGYLEPLSELVSSDVLESSQPTQLSRFGGDVYRVGWYPHPDGVVLQQGTL